MKVTAKYPKKLGDGYRDNEAANNSTSDSFLYPSWLIGTWTCNMGAYGVVSIRFDADGTCAEASSAGTFNYGSYSINGNTISYKLNGESYSTTIEIHSGNRLYAGEGYYYKKKN